MNIYDDILRNDPKWHHKEYPTITLEEVSEAQERDRARAYCELRLLRDEIGQWKKLYQDAHAEVGIQREEIEQLQQQCDDWQLLVEEIREYTVLSDEHKAEFNRIPHRVETTKDTTQ